MRLRPALRLAAALLAAASVLPLVPTSPAAAEDPAGAVTVAGRGAFADLRVTVSKTRALRDEVVQVSWTGGTATKGNFAVDYLQVFQCWGDAATGPEREQCQFGGLTGDNRGGAQVASRQVTYGITDPLETYRPRRPGELRFVPFRSVTGKTTEGALSEFFDGSTTNEVPFARTRPDGGGLVPFEVQTGVEAPGLGCGAPLATAAPPVTTPVSATPSATATAPLIPRRGPGSGGRGCWLVVVPRGSTEVDGSARSDDSTNQLLSSPLSATNWADRLVVPLDFAPLGQPCPLGRAERPVVGQEQASEVITSWQPSLCAGQKPVYSFSQVADAVARRQAVSDAAGLSIVTRPLSPDEVPAGRPARYAPLALSGITVAYQIDSQSGFNAPADVKARDGQPITTLDLTPRLVAKLLTQSYRLGAATQTRAGLEKNPLDLTRDPEFLRLNPAFKDLRYVGVPDVLVPAGLSDSGALVWQWLLADPEAKAFLSGTPDPDGMVVNPAYRGLGQQDGFPKADSVCQTFPTGQPPLCTLDAHPYAGDGHEAARGAARGDTLSRSTYDATAVPPVYRRSVPQPTGSRAVLALTDTATAARYGLHTARLRNASGAFVAPDDRSLLAGLAAFVPSGVPGVLAPDPATTAPDAYPLATLSYALTTPSVLTRQARTDYADLLRYAAGPGQVPGQAPGQLPPGYTPLPTSLRTQSLVLASALLAATPSPSPTDEGATAVPPAAPDVPGGSDPVPVLPVDTGSTGGAPVSGGGTTVPTGLPSSPLTPVAAPTPVPPVVAPVPDTVLVARGVTPADDVGLARYGPVVVLLLGALAALAGSWLARPARVATTP